MKSPFQIHADLTSAAQAFLGGQPWNGNRKLVATITIFGFEIPCTHSPLMKGWIEESGKSRRDYIEHCEFLASDLPQFVPNTNPPKPMIMALDKGVLCMLKPSQDLPGYKMMLFDGGIEPGAKLYRFMLVSQSYAA